MSHFQVQVAETFEPASGRFVSRLRATWFQEEVSVYVPVVVGEALVEGLLDALDFRAGFDLEVCVEEEVGEVFGTELAIDTDECWRAEGGPWESCLRSCGVRFDPAALVYLFIFDYVAVYSLAYVGGKACEGRGCEDQGILRLVVVD